MYRFIRTSHIKSTHVAQGIAFSAKINAYVNGRFPDLGMEVMVQHFGDVGRVSWQIDMDDLATYNEVTMALMEDGDYHALLAQGEELFIQGESKDALYTRLPQG